MFIKKKRDFSKKKLYIKSILFDNKLKRREKSLFLNEITYWDVFRFIPSIGNGYQRRQLYILENDVLCEH